MSGVLWAFLLGLVWAIGVLSGGALALRWKPVHKKRYEDHMEITEDRLAAYVLNTGRIADALEAMNRPDTITSGEAGKIDLSDFIDASMANRPGGTEDAGPAQEYDPCEVYDVRDGKVRLYCQTPDEAQAAVDEAGWEHFRWRQVKRPS